MISLPKTVEMSVNSLHIRSHSDSCRSSFISQMIFRIPSLEHYLDHFERILFKLVQTSVTGAVKCSDLLVKSNNVTWQMCFWDCLYSIESWKCIRLVSANFILWGWEKRLNSDISPYKCFAVKHWWLHWKLTFIENHMRIFVFVCALLECVRQWNFPPMKVSMYLGVLNSCNDSMRSFRQYIWMDKWIAYVPCSCNDCSVHSVFGGFQSRRAQWKPVNNEHIYRCNTWRISVWIAKNPN